MAMNEPFDWRRSDRRTYGAIALLFPIAVLIGFGPTYYLKGVLNGPPLPSPLVHVHGALMTTWIVLFITQVFLISSKRVHLHMRLGIFGAVLAPVIVIVGSITGIASAAAGRGVPGTPPLAFLMIPIGDMVMFAILFAGAMYYRKSPREHKRLMLLTVLNFVPAAFARFPFEAAGTPPFFYGVPDLLAIGFVIYDSVKNRKVNKVFLAATLLLIVSHVIRLTLSGTATWLSIATWLTSWAA